jgi:predicted O-methyltransferase YrrM
MMSDTTWRDVDKYFFDTIVHGDDVLKQALRDSKDAGLPPIAVSATQGKQLYLTALAIGAKRILEVGTLGGYSTIWLARALPRDGKLVSLEIDPKHAKVAKANVERAGLSAQVDIQVGPAIELLPKLQGPFDFAFIDADKESNADYFAHALRLSRKGSVIIVDNVVREGRVIDSKGNAQVQGVRRMIEQLSRDNRIAATAIQTVGDKGYDGYLMAVVL